MAISQYLQDYDGHYPSDIRSTCNAACSDTGTTDPAVYDTDLGYRSPLWWEETLPYTKNLQLLLRPSNTGAGLVSATKVHPS